MLLPTPAGWMSLTSVVPVAVPSETHSSCPVMPKPPSPTQATTQRSGAASFAATAAGNTGTRTNDAGRTLSTDHLAHLVMGLDLATARLVLASLDIHELLAASLGIEVGGTTNGSANGAAR